MMPLVHIDLIEGRSPEQLKALVKMLPPPLLRTPERRLSMSILS